MSNARIFQSPKSSTQSGRGGTDQWELVHMSGAPTTADPLTGWNGQADTQAQVQLSFPTLAAAEAYAQKKGIAYHVVPAPQPRLKLQAYADNFR